MQDTFKTLEEILKVGNPLFSPRFPKQEESYRESWRVSLQNE
jgi:hypothetical protein